MDNDAKSCYDRISCNPVMIVSRYFRMPRNACLTQAKTLRSMEFRLRTALGDSKRCYSHSNEYPVHGSGQGSCASSCIWLLISSILMDCLAAKANGMQAFDVTSSISNQQWIDGFVDDTSIFTNNTANNSSIDDLRKRLSSDATAWASLLEASGGKLELSKCFYYLLTWKFNSEGDPTPMSINEQMLHTSSIQITGGSNTEVTTITQLEVDKPHKTLGTWKTISGKEQGGQSYRIFIQQKQPISKKDSECKSITPSS